MPVAAASYDLPQAYLHEQLQALARAELVESLPGARGGFLLARPADQITLMDVVTALEGPEPAFTCTEIRRRGMGEDAPRSAFRRTCAVHGAMQRAGLSAIPNSHSGSRESGRTVFCKRCRFPISHI